MTVRIANVESEFAAKVLAQKLTEAGLAIQTDEAVPQRIRVEWAGESTQLLVDVLEAFVFTDWQYEFIDKKIGALHPYLNSDEQEYVALLTFHAVKKEEDLIDGSTVQDWHTKIRLAFEGIFEEREQERVFLDGVVRFRAREYLAAVESTIHDMVDQFLTDREYEEFVSMLRFMLDAQPATSQVLNVYCSNELVWICDENGELVRDSEVSNAATQVSEGEEVNAEDLAMSILITRSPCKIVIHDSMTDPPWPSFAETVERVFLDRATRCKGCAACKTFENEEQRLPRGRKRAHVHHTPGE